MKKIKRALVSLSNKKNLYKLLSVLKKYKIQIISSGGTYKQIKKLNFNCTEISKYTGSPEILEGRVKTLHPKIHAGILSERNKKSHKNDLLKNNFSEIDLVIANFYPVEEVLSKTNNHSKIIENIDIGGTTLVRAAAKNYKYVTVITDPSQYNDLINELISKGIKVIDPQTTYIDKSVKITGKGIEIHPNTFIKGETEINDNCTIGRSHRPSNCFRLDTFANPLGCS